ncbi:MAG: acetolactate synthase small subunit [Candidatus Bathyarchaeia archaeon]
MRDLKTFIFGTLVEHKPGVLQKVSNMFRQRNFNIESITVGPTERGDIARMTITMKGEEEDAVQLEKQLRKLIDVLEVKLLEPSETVVRELALVKVRVGDWRARSDLVNWANIFRSRIVDVSPDSIEITGAPSKIDAFLELMKRFELLEVSRTGITAMERGLNRIGLK